LVELLVVIGIIALLISILLPSLNKARQAANSAACLSNEHQIGLAIAQYAAESHGFLPYGYAIALQGGGWWNTPTWGWADTLSMLVGSKKTQNDNGPQYGGNSSWDSPNLGNMAYDFSGMFHDKDIYASGWADRANDYECNPRIMPDVTYYDSYAQAATGASNCYLGLRKYANLHNSQTVMMAWCAGVFLSSDGTDHGGESVADQIDQGNLNTALGLCYPPPPGYGWAAGMIQNRIALGTGNSPISSYSGGDTMTNLRRENVDYTNSGYDNAADMRFRHKGNTSCNALFIDGHCESRLLGNVYGRDILVNPPSVFHGPPGT
jgi:prepilin-type processing-associated H-X9-DG protein